MRIGALFPAPEMRSGASQFIIYYFQERFKSMEQKHLARLNELAKLAKARPLTAEETAERAELRREYLATFRAAFQQQLDNTVIQYDDGTRVPMSAFKKLHQAEEAEKNAKKP